MSKTIQNFESNPILRKKAITFICRICELYSLPYEQFTKNTRVKKLIPIQVVAWVILNESNMPFKDIAELFNDRNISGIAKPCKYFRENKANLPDTHSLYNELKIKALECGL